MRTNPTRNPDRSREPGSSNGRGPRPTVRAVGNDLAVQLRGLALGDWIVR